MISAHGCWVMSLHYIYSTQTRWCGSFMTKKGCNHFKGSVKAIAADLEQKAREPSVSVLIYTRSLAKLQDGTRRFTEISCSGSQGGSAQGRGRETTYRMQITRETAECTEKVIKMHSMKTICLAVTWERNWKMSSGPSLEDSSKALSRAWVNDPARSKTWKPYSLTGRCMYCL